MGHYWKEIFGARATACFNCGILLSDSTNKLPCPPWKEKTKGENTNAERIHEAELINMLKKVNVFLKDCRDCGYFSGTQVYNDAEINILLIEHFIQKHEGCLGDSTE